MNSDTTTPVMCRASVNCAGGSGDDLGEMTLGDCCVNNPRGLAYSLIGSERCVACVGEL